MRAGSGTRRIAVFGGTFDPIHYGHLECAQCAKDVLELDKVIFMPCSIPHFKREQQVSDAYDRLAMCRLACATNCGFEVSDLEVERGGVTYTIDTIENLIAELPEDTRISFILGTDAFMSVAGWRGADRLISLVDFIVVSRPGESLKDARDYAIENGISMTPVECPQLDISSSTIRNLLEEGRSARYLTPDTVLSYIARKGLYRKKADTCNFDEGAPSSKASPEDVFSEKFYKARWKDLKSRVSKKRLKHIEGVADTSRLLAKTYGVDEESAYLAGLLHDWDKGLNDEEIRERIKSLGLEDEVDPYVVQKMPQVLHGPTAACALASDFPQIPEDVIRAIKEHTTSSANPDDLSKVLYIADAIEPTRSFDGVDSYRQKIGVVSLDELFLDIYRFWTLALVKRGKPLHPDTVAIWNALIEE